MAQPQEIDFQTHLLTLMQQLADDDAPIEEALVKICQIARVVSGARLCRVVMEDETGGVVSIGDPHNAKTPLADSAIYHYVSKSGDVVGRALADLSVSPAAVPQGVTKLATMSIMVRGQRLGVLWCGLEEDSILSDLAVNQIKILLAAVAVSLGHQSDYRAVAVRYSQLYAMFASMRDAVVLLNEDLLVEALNPAAERFFAVPMLEARGMPLDRLVQDDELSRFVRQKSAERDNRFYLSRGDTHFQPLFTDVISEDQMRFGKLLVLADVSHFKRLNENMTMFLQTVSHDLRSPLTAAKGFADMLSMVGELNEKQEGMREKILTSIVDMTNLVEKVLDAGRLDPEMGVYELRREMADPVELVQKVVTQLNGAANRKNITLLTSGDGALPMVNIDTMMMERALVNLAENAIKYTPEGGTVQVGTTIIENDIHFFVEDNGLGIPPEKIDTLFDRGSRVRRDEHKAIRGSGLGLFIVKNVAQQHRGTATVESQEGEGSRFSISFPLDGDNIIGGTG